VGKRTARGRGEEVKKRGEGGGKGEEAREQRKRNREGDVREKSD
jgi:hypothetical protein